jgi:hypothetical protein
MKTTTDMTATIKSNYRTTFHRDGSVSFWSVYQQQWMREQAIHVSDKHLASMSSHDRERVVKMVKSWSEGPRETFSEHVIRVLSLTDLQPDPPVKREVPEGFVAPDFDE